MPQAGHITISSLILFPQLWQYFRPAVLKLSVVDTNPDCEGFA